MFTEKERERFRWQSGKATEKTLLTNLEGSDNESTSIHLQRQVEEIIDADTYDLLVDCGFGIYSKQRFRLSGIIVQKLGDLSTKQKELMGKQQKKWSPSSSEDKTL
jgi:hypothetical protein